MRILTFLMVLLFAFNASAGQQSSLPLVHPNAKKQYVIVLMWHDVVKGKKQVWFDTTVEEFQKQLEEIKRRKCSFITLDMLNNHLRTGAKLPPRPIMLTFDDNNLGIYTHVFPLLKQHRIPATLFVHTNYVGVTTSKPHCDWKMLQTMQASGLVTVQSLTSNHPSDLRKLSDTQIEKEMRDSKVAIEKRLGSNVLAIAYPEGKFDDRTARIAWKVGYQLGFMEDWGSASSSKNLLLIHRYSIHKRFDQAMRDISKAYPNQKN